MHALVFGGGSMGARHTRNLLEMSQIDNVSLCDIDPDVTDKIEDEFGIQTTVDVEQAFDIDPDFVIISTPPASHIPLANKSLDNSCHVFIEKPLSDSTEGVREFQQRAEQSELVAMVACNMRFHPPVKLVHQWLTQGRIGGLEYFRLRYGNRLTNWRSGDYQNHYSAQADKGGGIILDAIHEIDLALEWLTDPKTVQCAAGKCSNLKIDVEDVAEILFEGSKQICAVQLDYLRPRRARTYEFIGSDGLIEWTARGKDPEQSTVELQASDGEQLSKSFELTLNEMYVNEMEHFLDCVQTGTTPEMDPSMAIGALDAALEAREAAKSGMRREFDAGPYAP